MTGALLDGPTAVLARPADPGSAAHDPAATTTPVARPGPWTGELFGGRYRIGELIGRGGSATVYRGLDTRLGRPVAVKIFEPSMADSRAPHRRRAEVDLLARLSHPGLVALLDAHITTTDAAPLEPSYLVMELVEGSSLERRLIGGAVLSPDTTADLGRQLATALAVVHRSAMIHRDIKPGNILLDHTGAAKLADFGIARLIDSARVTFTAEVMGTPRYLSPEQARGRRVTPATDVYSLGLVLLECLTGSPAFPGSGLESAVTRLVRDPELPTSLPPDWANLLRNMTDLDPDRRPTAVAVARTLTGLLPDDHHARTAVTVISTARPDPPTGQPPRPPSRARARARVLTLACSAAVLVAAVSSAVVLWTDPVGRTTDRLDSRPSPPAPNADSPTPVHRQTVTSAVGNQSSDGPEEQSLTTPPGESGAVVRFLILSNAPFPATTTTITVTAAVPPWGPAPDPTTTTSTTTTSTTTTQSGETGTPPTTSAPTTAPPSTTPNGSAATTADPVPTSVRPTLDGSVTGSPPMTPPPMTSPPN